MNFKKITGALTALCIIAVPFADYGRKIDFRTSAVEEVYISQEIVLDNEHPSAIANLKGIEVRSWYTSDPDVATVDENGTVTATGKGNCVISAACKDFVYKVNVVSKYEPAEQGMTEVIMSDIMLTNSRKSQQIVFTVPSGTVITYSTSDENVATVDENGVVTATGMGKCQIFADIENKRHIFNVTSVYTGVESGAVDIGSLTLTADVPVQTITISGIPQDTQITWSSSDENTAVVSKIGTVSGIKKGSCIVYAETEDRKYAMNITVDFDIQDIMKTFELKEGEILQLSYTNMENILFTSSDENVASVSSNGLVTTKGTGETVIKAESDNGVVWSLVKVSESTVNPSCILLGDANCDGKVNVADATAIIQHIGNQDEYCLSEQGLANAELCDGKETLTGMDAIAIQQLISGIIDSLNQP